MAKLTFKTNFGKFRKGETHEVTGITADYFLNNNIAEEVIEKKEDCGCNDTAKLAEVTAVEEVVVVEKKSTKKK